MGANQSKPTVPRVISIQGSIGAGKSTLLAELKKEFEGNPEICFLREPLDDWNEVRDEEGRPMLELFYANPSKMALSFQTLVFLTRYQLIDEAIKKGYKIIVTERCLESDTIFANMSRELNNLSSVDFQVYSKMYSQFRIENIEKQFVYLTTSPKVCFDRIQIRKRPGEEKINMEYLSKLDHHHRKFLLGNKNILLLNGDMNMHEHKNLHEEWIREIEPFLK